jgi:tRNA 2-thiouridine synthesizing protein A
VVTGPGKTGTSASPQRGEGRQEGDLASRQILDLCGLKCPLPVLRTRKALTRLVSGDTLEIVCTDPMAQIDIPHLLHDTGDHLLDVSSDAGHFVFRIRKT